MALPAGDTKGWGGVVLTITTTRQAIAVEPHTRVQVLKNTGAGTIFIGGVDITSANTATDAYPLAASEILTLNMTSTEGALGVPLYAVTASATQTLAILRGDV